MLILVTKFHSCIFCTFRPQKMCWNEVKSPTKVSTTTSDPRHVSIFLPLFSILIATFILLQTFQATKDTVSWKQQCNCQNVTLVQQISSEPSDSSPAEKLAFKLLELESILMKLHHKKQTLPMSAIDELRKLHDDISFIRISMQKRIGVSVDTDSATSVLPQPSSEDCPICPTAESCPKTICHECEPCPTDENCPECPVAKETLPFSTIEAPTCECNCPSCGLENCPACPTVESRSTTEAPTCECNCPESGLELCPACPTVEFHSETTPVECPEISASQFPKTEHVLGGSDVWVWRWHQWRRAVTREIRCSGSFKVSLMPSNVTAIFSPSDVKPYGRRVCGLKSIPKSIHVFWDSVDLCTYNGTDEKLQDLHSNLMNTKRVNPNWKIQCWNDVQAIEIVRKAEPRLVEHYKNIEAKMYRADIFRLCLLKLEGGVYVDADVEHLRPMDQIFDLMGNPKFMAIYTVQNLIGVPPNHEFIDFMIGQYLKIYSKQSYELTTVPGHDVSNCLRGLTAGPCFWKAGIDYFRPIDIAYLIESRWNGRYYVHLNGTGVKDALFWSKFLSYANERGWDTFGTKADKAHEAQRASNLKRFKESKIEEEIQSRTESAIEWLEKKLNLNQDSSKEQIDLQRDSTNDSFAVQISLPPRDANQSLSLKNGTSNNEQSDIHDTITNMIESTMEKLENQDSESASLSLQNRIDTSVLNQSLSSKNETEANNDQSYNHETIQNMLESAMKELEKKSSDNASMSIRNRKDKMFQGESKWLKEKLEHLDRDRDAFKKQFGKSDIDPKSTSDQLSTVEDKALEAEAAIQKLVKGKDSVPNTGNDESLPPIFGKS